MKTHHYRRAHGFTLVELLVVIAIIAVLAGAGFAAGNAAITKAKKMTAQSTITAIESAVNNFYTEYGAMPKDISSDTRIDTETDRDTLKVLLGMTETANPPLNARAIKFLNVKEGKGNKNGLIYTGSSSNDIQGLYDPWGGKYYIMLDGDYDEIITPTPSAGNGPRLNGRRVAAWSNGPDAVKGTGGKATDDVKSW